MGRIIVSFLFLARWHLTGPDSRLKIDMDEEESGVQEGKEWLALMEFLGSMQDFDYDGIPDIDKKYTVPVRTFFSVSK